MHHRNRTFLIALLCLTGVCAQTQNSKQAKEPASASSTSSSSTAKATLPSEATVDSFLKKMFGWNQDLSWKVIDIKPSEAAGISQATIVFNTPRGPEPVHLYITPDQRFAFMADLLPFGADPFAGAREILKGAKGPTRGLQGAPITIVEFGDLECPACKAAQPNITKLVEEEPKVKLIFENYPLEQIHKWAMPAAKYVDCLAHENNDVAWKFISTTYDHQSEITPENAGQMLKGYVKDSGGDPDAVAACVAKPETEKQVRESMALGEKLNVTSTPTFFINGRRVVGFSTNNTPYDAVKAMVDYDLLNPK